MLHDFVKPLRDLFRKFAKKTSEVVGSPWAFVIALLVVVVWLLCGPRAGYSDTWQLIINTGTTIVTFLMVFLIQNMQNRDALAIHLKLDELIHGVKHARNSMIDLERFSDDELAKLHHEFEELCTRRKIHRKPTSAPKTATNDPSA